MEYIFPTLLASFLLFFILFLFVGKTGFSQIGNAIIVFLAFSFVLSILFLKDFFPFWGVCLLVLALCLCTTYLLQSKFSHLLFQEEEISTASLSKYLDEEEAYTLFLEKYKDRYTGVAESLFIKEPAAKDSEDLKQLLERNKKEEGSAL
jgi:energy-coupling factor transporter transmembrane protein EcfT